MTSIEKFKKNINSYGKSIRTMGSFTEAVRKTPGQYIGYVGDKGFINMIREVFQNSMDELMKDKSPCTEIWTEYYEDTNTFVSMDNGRGIPFDNIERIFTKPNTSSNFDKEKGTGEFSSGRHGVGAKVTNALSSRFIVDSYLCKEVSPSGKAEHRHMEFIEGFPWSKGEVSQPNKENRQGSRIEFSPCYDIMGEITTTCDDVLNLISTLVPLMKIGAIVNFKGVTKRGQVIEKRLVNEKGILTFLDTMTKKRVCDPIYISGMNPEKTMRAEIAFTWGADDIDSSEEVVSFGNMCPTISQSIHVSALVDAVATYFRNYLNKFVFNNSSKISVINNDIKSGFKGVISAFHIEPMFSGQAKEILSNADLEPFIKDLVKLALDEWCKKNADGVSRISNHAKAAATLRLNVTKEKIDTLKKSQVSVFTGLPSKYGKPTGKKNLEFILVEGDSALNPCRTAIDHSCQGIFPLRGKVKNAMTCSRKDFFDNEENKAIYTILGCGAGKACDPDKCKFDKIIFLADADTDGLHIRSLLLKMFLIYYRPLVEQGRVYAAIPPLYGIKKKNKRMVTKDDYLSNMQYFTDKSEYIEYIYKLFAKNHVITQWDGTPFHGKEIERLLNKNFNYLQNMDILCQDYATDPELMETLYKLITRKTPLNGIKKAIHKEYPYLSVREENGCLVVDGLAKDKVQTLIFTSNMLKDCYRLIGDSINENYKDEGYQIDGKRVSLYTLMKTLDDSKPDTIQRYKGLGEMNPVELMISTIHPAYNRTLIQFTAEDMQREINEIRRLDTDKHNLLDDVDVAGYDI